jgi:hypothetical protein
MRTYAGKLVRTGHTANDGVVAYFHMAGQLYRVGKYYVVAQDAVVRNMGISHQQAVAAYYSLHFILSAPVYRYTLTDGGIVPNLYNRFFAFKLQVLGHGTQHGARKYSAVLTNYGVRHNNSMRHNVRAIAYSYLVMDHSKGVNGYIVAQLCVGMNGCQR